AAPGARAAPGCRLKGKAPRPVGGFFAGALSFVPRVKETNAAAPNAPASNRAICFRLTVISGLTSLPPLARVQLRAPQQLVQVVELHTPPAAVGVAVRGEQPRPGNRANPRRNGRAAIRLQTEKAGGSHLISACGE